MSLSQKDLVLGSKFDGAAQEDHDGDRLFSAGAKYRRASLCYFMANRMMSHHDARQIQSYNKGVEAFAAHLQAAGEPAELIDVPYQDTSLPAILSKAPGDGPKPCMVHFDGFDFLKEFNYTITAEAPQARRLGSLCRPSGGGRRIAVARLAQLPRIRSTGRRRRRLPGRAPRHRRRTHRHGRP